MKYSLLTILMATLFFGGCSTAKIAATMAQPLVQGQYVSIQKEPDPTFARQAMPASLKMMEGLLEQSPKDEFLLLHLAEGYCGYAFSFLETNDPQRAVLHYDRGRGYALRALARTSPELMEQNLDDYTTAVEAMEPGNLPALYWLGQCWGGWLMLSLDRPEAFADIPRLQRLIERTLELDPTFHFAGPHLLAGAFYGGRSKLLGGDMDKAGSHFEENLRLTEGKFLLSRVLYAKTLLVQTQDRDAFLKQLNLVLETPAEILPQQRLANEVAKIKAKKLLESVDDLF
jgi:hypothetical protein